MVSYHTHTDTRWLSTQRHKMERIEADATPAEEWLQSLHATCNRLSTQYLNLLRAAASSNNSSGNNNQSSSSTTTTATNTKHDPRAGGGHMRNPTDPPPPPLAADTALSTLQTATATENICVATAQIMSLIRTLQLSLLLQDYDTQQAEEEHQVWTAMELTRQAQEQAALLEQQVLLQVVASSAATTSQAFASENE